MTPEERQEINELKSQMQEFLAWKESREIQQITYPLDETSRVILEREDIAIAATGTSGLTQNKNLSGDAETIQVPAAYTGWVQITRDGATYKVPTIA